MACVYRYRDLNDGVVKYVGIVYSESRSLRQRVNEHKQEEWYKNGVYEVDYIKSDVKTRTDAETLEAHYIALYKTDKWYNVAKTGWGLSSYVNYKETDWVKYDENTYTENGAADLVEENDMAESIAKELLSVRYTKERKSFWHKIRSKKNRHTVKSDLEHTYWKNVLLKVNDQIGCMLFGDAYKQLSTDVRVGGNGEILLGIKNFGQIIYNPYDHNFQFTSNREKFYTIQQLQDYIADMIYSFKECLLNINESNTPIKTQSDKRNLYQVDGISLEVENNTFDIEKWMGIYKYFVETFYNGVGISYDDISNPKSKHTFYVRNENGEYQLSGGGTVSLSKKDFTALIKMLIDKYQLELSEI